MVEITIRNAEKAWFRYNDGSFPDTRLPYFSSLEWRYTEERAIRLIEYIREHLEKANEMEVWHTWAGSDRDESEEIKKHHINAGDITPSDVEAMFVSEQYDCMAIKK